MKRKDLIKHISQYNFKTTKRIKGSHEIFKSDAYKFNFSIPTGKSVKKGLLWNFKTKIKEANQHN